MSVTELEHVLLLSDDIDRARSFYQQTLGLKQGSRPPLPFDGYWMYAGPTACLHIADRESYRAHAVRMGLEVRERPSGPGPIDHIAFNSSDYEALLARLDQLGVDAVLNQIPDGGPRQVFFHDPDGLRVEINVKA